MRVATWAVRGIQGPALNSCTPSPAGTAHTLQQSANVHALRSLGCRCQHSTMKLKLLLAALLAVALLRRGGQEAHE